MALIDDVSRLDIVVNGHEVSLLCPPMVSPNCVAASPNRIQNDLARNGCVKGILRNSIASCASTCSLNSPLSPARCHSVSTMVATASSIDTTDARQLTTAKRCVSFIEQPNIHEYELPSDESIRSHSIHELRRANDASDAAAADASNLVATHDDSTRKRRGLFKKVERRSKTKAAITTPTNASKYDYRKWVSGGSSPRAPANVSVASPNMSPSKSSRQMVTGSRRASRLMLAALSGAALGAVTAPAPTSAWRKPVEAKSVPQGIVNHTSTFASPTRSSSQKETSTTASPVQSPGSSTPRTSFAASPDHNADHANSPPTSPSDSEDYAAAFLRRRKLAKAKVDVVRAPGEPSEDHTVIAEVRKSEMRLREALLDSYPRASGEIVHEGEDGSDTDEETDAIVTDGFGSPDTEPADSSFEEDAEPNNNPDCANDAINTTRDIDRAAFEQSLSGTARALANHEDFQRKDDGVTNDGTDVIVRTVAIVHPEVAPLLPKHCVEALPCASPVSVPPKCNIFTSPSATNTSLDTTISEHCTPESHQSSDISTHEGSPSLLRLQSPSRSIVAMSPSSRLPTSPEGRILSSLELLSPERTHLDSAPAPPTCPFAIGDAVIVAYSARMTYNGSVYDIRVDSEEALIKYDGMPMSRAEWRPFSQLTLALTAPKRLRSRDLSGVTSGEKRSRGEEQETDSRNVRRRKST